VWTKCRKQLKAKLEEKLPTFAFFLVRVLLPRVILLVPRPVLIPIPLRPIPLLFPWKLGSFIIFIFALELKIFLSIVSRKSTLGQIPKGMVPPKPCSTEL
jgi:hypothetical protein